MTFRIHPLLIVWFALLVATGQAGLFSLVFASLLVHELGHIAALSLFGVTKLRITFLPFGGRIDPIQTVPLSAAKLALVYAAGPLATAGLIALLCLLPVPLPHLILQVQVAILVLNLLPIPPLDGGNIVKVLTRNTVFEDYVKPIYFATYCLFGIYAYTKLMELNFFPLIIWIVLGIENYKANKS